MATFDKGILGGFSGKIGPVVGSTWKGRDVMRSRPGRRKRTSTIAQIDQQLKFTVGMEFLQPMTGLIDVTFRNYAINQTAFNSAFSYTLKNAISGLSPDYVIDYSKALVSRGNLTGAAAPTATVANGIIYFTWTDNSGIGNASPSDNSVLVVYCKELKTAIFNLQGAQRDKAAAQVTAAQLINQTVEVWMSFITASGNEAADSTYLGSLVIS